MTIITTDGKRQQRAYMCPRTGEDILFGILRASNRWTVDSKDKTITMPDADYAALTDAVIADLDVAREIEHHAERLYDAFYEATEDEEAVVDLEMLYHRTKGKPPLGGVAAAAQTGLSALLLRVRKIFNDRGLDASIFDGE